MSAKDLYGFFEELINEPEKFGSIEELKTSSKEMFDEIVRSIEGEPAEKREELEKELL